MYSLKVHCSNSDCTWTGELGELERHKAATCQYTVAECRYGCGAKYPRHVLGIHERDKCSKCPIEDRVEGLSQRLDEEITVIEKKYNNDLTGLRSTIEEQNGVIERMKADHLKETKLLQEEMKKLTTEIKNIKRSIQDGNQQNNEQPQQQQQQGK